MAGTKSKLKRSFCAGQTQPGTNGGQSGNAQPQETGFGRASMETPGVTQDSARKDVDAVKAAREKFEQERDPLHNWRHKHKVDAAGFVG